MAYVDLNVAFDSVYRQALWQPLTDLGIPQKLIWLLSALYTITSNSSHVNRILSEQFVVDSGIRQGCLIAPDLFDTLMDWIMERTTHWAF